jgi:hypothetical protein
VEEDRESPSDDSFDDFIDKHYFEVEDMDYWIDRIKEILTRWQEEKAFVMQLEDDVVIRDVFGVVVNERERTDDENVWFSSGIKTINRAAMNRFNMLSAMDREEKLATELSKNDECLDGVAKELEHFMIMMRTFQNEGDFDFLYKRTRSAILQEFVNWRADPENREMESGPRKETVVAATQADDIYAFASSEEAPGEDTPDEKT